MKIALEIFSIYVIYSLWVIYEYTNLGKISNLIKPGNNNYIISKKYILIVAKATIISFIAIYLLNKMYDLKSILIFATGLLFSSPMLSIGSYYEIIRQESITEKGFGFFTNNLYDDSLLTHEKIFKYFVMRLLLWVFGFILILNSLIIK